MRCLHLVQTSSGNSHGGGFWRCCHPSRKHGACRGYEKCPDHEVETDHEGLEGETTRKRLHGPMRKVAKALGLEEPRGEEIEENEADTINLLTDNMEGNDS